MSDIDDPDDNVEEVLSVNADETLEKEDRGDDLEPVAKVEPTKEEPKDEVDLEALKAVADDGEERGIPKARFNEVNDRMKAAEQAARDLQERLAALEAASKPKEEVKTFDMDAHERACMEALMAGDTDKALELRREINAEIKRQAKQDAENVISTQLSQRELQERINQVAAQAIEQYPFLNAGAVNANEAAIAEVVEWRDFYAAKGQPMHEALKMAVAKVAPLYERPEPELPKQTLTDPRKKEAIVRGAQASAAQPAQLGGRGERASEKSRDDVATMTDEEFDALPKSERKRLRGDI